MDAATLKTAISEVCPVVAATVNEPVDRTQWSFVPAPEATQKQIDSGYTVLMTIPTDPTTSVSMSDWLARWTNQEYLSLEKKRAADIAADKIGNAKNWDIVTADDVIDFNRKKVQTLRADLVADGILTEQRASEIFS